MKTTIDLDDELLLEAKRRAVEGGSTLKRVVEDALRRTFEEVAPDEAYVFDLPAVDAGPLLVDPADRDALYELMEGDA